MAARQDVLTIQEAAELLRVGERTVYDLARERRMPAAKVGGQWRIRRQDLEDWLERGGEAATQDGDAR